MTDTEQGFLRAAAAAPADDLPRLIYADWLSEQGTHALAAQGEFVRLQVRRSALGLADLRRAALLDEEAALLKQYGRAWNGRLHRHLHRLGLRNIVASRRAPIRGWEYHRGMVGVVRIAADSLDGITADDLYSIGPITLLRVIGWHASGPEPRLDQFAGRLQALALRGQQHHLPLPLFPQTVPLQRVPLLDLRGSGFLPNTDLLATLDWSARHSTSPVILIRLATGPAGVATATRVIDPFHHWPGLRPWYEDLTGERIDAVPYHPTSR